MFWDEKTKTFRKLKRILRDLEKIDDDVKRRNFEQALKDLRFGYLENKKFFDWLKKKHSRKIDKKDLTYGSEYLDHQFDKARNMLMQLKGTFGKEREYAAAHELVKEMEKMVIWELKAQKQHLKHNLDVVGLSQEEILDRITKTDRKLYGIIKKYKLDDPVNFIVIQNEDQEKEKFMATFKKGREYNPQFTYATIPENVLSKAEAEAKDAMDTLRSINLDFTKGAAMLVEKKRFNLISTLNLIRAIGTNKITKYSIQLYGFPSDKLISEAASALELSKRAVEQKLNAKLEEEKYSAKQFKKRVDAYLRKKKIPWKTVIKTDKEMGSRSKTVNVKKQIWINKDRVPFSEKDILKIIEHEIQVHVARLEFGARSPIKILAYGTSGYLATEEGLSSYFEELRQLRNKKYPEARHLYVITEYFAVRGGFYYCFTQLVNYGVDPDKAWDRVYRIKRGLSNTGQKGGFFKDHVYFLGERLVNEFVAAGGNIQDLLVGKISINDLKYLTAKYKL
jgi:hypothetical protein